MPMTPSTDRHQMANETKSCCSSTSPLLQIQPGAARPAPTSSARYSVGAALGTVLAFMMAVIALSLPEMVILRKVLKPRLIVTFIGVVGFGILLVGYLFNLLPLEGVVAPGLPGQ